MTQLSQVFNVTRFTLTDVHREDLLSEQFAVGLSNLKAEIPLNSRVSWGDGNLNPLNLSDTGTGAQ